MLSGLKIFLSDEETEAHKTWFASSCNKMNQVSAGMWLHALGLPCASKNIITEEQLEKKLSDDEIGNLIHFLVKTGYEGVSF